MTGDLLRQLDAYGDHVVASINHVDASEVQVTSAMRSSSQQRVWTRWVVPVGAVVVVAFVAVGLGTSTSPVDQQFQEVGAAFSDGGGADRSRRAGTDAPTTNPPQTEAPADSLATAPRLLSAVPGLPDSGSPLPASPAGRDIVFSADLTVSVSNVEEASSEARTIVEGVGGFVAGERSTGGADAKTVITLKVPPAAFQDTLVRLGELGVVTERRVTSDDVTEVVVDLESQILTAEGSVERLRTLLAEAATVNELARIERELTRRETDLERLRGQLRTLRDRVDMTTITATLTEAIPVPSIRIAVTAYPSRGDGGANCPGRTPEIAEGGEATVCIEVANNGETQLTDVELTGPGREALPQSLVSVDGDLAGVLEPGEVVVLAADVTVTERFRDDFTVTAVPVNEVGDPVPSRQVSKTRRLVIEVADPGGLPGFGDALSSGWSLLKTSGSLALAVLGFVLPWLWVPFVVAAVLWWRRRRGL
jgi:hypothetical protein